MRRSRKYNTMNYTTIKSDDKLFSSAIVGEIYEQYYGKRYTHVIDSSFSLYKKGIWKKIEKNMGNFSVQKTVNFHNDNKLPLVTEAFYTSKDKFLLVAVKADYDHKDMSDVGDDIEVKFTPEGMEFTLGGHEPEYEYEDDDDYENMDKVLKVDPKADFNAKFVILCDADAYDTALKFMKKVLTSERKKKKELRELNILCNSGQGTYLRSFKTSDVNIDIDDNYNDDFKPVSDEIIRRLNKKDNNGIVLLHSEPGCGKTSFIRHLTQKVKNKTMIYMPPDLATRLSDPDFMGFLMDYPNSVLFIEDAENCLLKREGGGNQAVSNLLNNSDGLLGDALKLQIVCTFNCDVKLIDPALMRPGRLIAEYRFEKLKKEKSQKLLDKIHEGEEAPTATGDMTLAEIYNIKEKRLISKVDQGKIGFKSY